MCIFGAPLAHKNRINHSKAPPNTQKGHQTKSSPSSFLFPFIIPKDLLEFTLRLAEEFRMPGSELAEHRCMLMQHLLQMYTIRQLDEISHNNLMQWRWWATQFLYHYVSCGFRVYPKFSGFTDFLDTPPSPAESVHPGHLCQNTTFLTFLTKQWFLVFSWPTKHVKIGIKHEILVKPLNFMKKVCFLGPKMTTFSTFP